MSQYNSVFILQLLCFPHRPYDRIADVLGMKTTTVHLLLQRTRGITPFGTDNYPSTTRGTQTPTPSAFDNFAIGAIGRYVHSEFAKKNTFTIKSLTQGLHEKGIIPAGAS